MWSVLWLDIRVCQLTKIAKTHFRSFETVLERRNELAEVHFCLNVFNGIHRYLSALVSNLVSAFAFEVRNEAGWLKCFGVPGTMVSIVFGRAKGEQGIRESLDQGFSKVEDPGKGLVMVRGEASDLASDVGNLQGFTPVIALRISK